MGLATQARLLSILNANNESSVHDPYPEDPYKYDVVISFAGEDRPSAQKIADFLIAKGFEVFYDEYLQDTLLGKNLYDHFAEIYSGARLHCIVLASAHYARKAWTTHERRSAQARALNEQGEYILPIRLDDTPIPGLLETVGYLDLRRLSIEKACEILLAKLLRSVKLFLRPARRLHATIEGNIAKSFKLMGADGREEVGHGEDLLESLRSEPRLSRIEKESSGVGEVDVSE
jgi:hypothetical protein